MAHRLTHPRDATTLQQLLLLLQRLRLPQHDYYLTLGWSGGNFCIHERQLEEVANRGVCGPALAAVHGSEWPRVPHDDLMTPPATLRTDYHLTLSIWVNETDHLMRMLGRRQHHKDENFSRVASQCTMFVLTSATPLVDHCTVFVHVYRHTQLTHTQFPDVAGVTQH